LLYNWKVYDLKSLSNKDSTTNARKIISGEHAVRAEKMEHLNGQTTYVNQI